MTTKTIHIEAPFSRAAVILHACNSQLVAIKEASWNSTSQSWTLQLMGPVSKIRMVRQLAHGGMASIRESEASKLDRTMNGYRV
jgi:hemolysin-activating ACP:hemolysin acyltransferase